MSRSVCRSDFSDDDLRPWFGNLLMVDVNRDRRWTVPINRAPGFGNPEVYHPRWTRHPRFMAMSGPYDRGGANQVRSGGTQAEIWLGRFNADFTQIEEWARVTSNGGGDSYPDVWIDLEASPHPRLASGRLAPANAEATATPDRIVVEAREHDTYRVIVRHGSYLIGGARVLTAAGTDA